MVFLPYFSMLIWSLPYLGLGSKSTCLTPGTMYIAQGSTIRFVGSWIWFRGFLFSSGQVFGQMESINVAGVFQEAWDADSRAHTRSQVWVEYFIIAYTSPFIRFSHLYQQLNVHYIVIINDWRMGWERQEPVDSYQGVGGRTGGGYYVIEVFNCAFVFCSLMSCLFLQVRRAW